MISSYFFVFLRLTRLNAARSTVVLTALLGGSAVLMQGTAFASSGQDAGNSSLTPTSQVDAATAAAIPCAQLRTETFVNVPEAPTTILSAQVIPASASTAEHCEVRGYVAPQIQFAIRLPTKNWNGRFLQGGCGGFCGVINIDACTDALAQNFVVAADNMGHVGDPLKEPLWGNDSQLRRDYGARSPHVVAVAAKAIIAKYYGVAPAYSYLRGCSTGGREGLSEAQRFPGDFDGIIAGDPAFPGRLGAIANAWDARNLFSEKGEHVIPEGKVKLLHSAVLRQCDAIDGLRDGIISYPPACHFDAEALACPKGRDRPDCLTDIQVQAAKATYGGPRDSRGHRLYPGSAPYGSELAWYQWIIPALPDGYLQHLAFQQDPPPIHSYREFDFDRDLPKVEAAAREYDPVAPYEAPDLRAFQARGGKLMVYQGWADPGVSPFATLDYYAQVTSREGGIAHVRDWFRVFMVPGMFHCRGGEVPNQFDTLGAMTAWVEKREPPQRIIASQLDSNGHLVRARPLFPYPTVARYNGSGAADEASSWIPVEPKTTPDDRIEWIWSPATAASSPAATHTP